MPLFGGIGMTELLIILAIVVLIFGASRLPEIGRGLGTGIQEFRKSVKGVAKGKDQDQIDSEEDKKQISDKSE
jgi:sec-independent protein translocase protein TatA